MKILSIECSAVPCSAAVLADGEIISSDFINEKLTHSQTLMPMVEKVLFNSGLSVRNIDLFALSNGPGSFTGVRIGISAIKGLAAPENKACLGLSTLEIMAENYRDTNCIICAVMDARCSQVYNALFDITDGKITRLCEDRALMCDELAQNLKNLSQNENKCIIIVGDGADIFYPFVSDIESIKKAPSERVFQNAVSVAKAAYNYHLAGVSGISPKELLPVYLRLPQAERELKLKKEKTK